MSNSAFGDHIDRLLAGGDEGVNDVASTNVDVDAFFELLSKIDEQIDRSNLEGDDFDVDDPGASLLDDILAGRISQEDLEEEGVFDNATAPLPEGDKSELTALSRLHAYFENSFADHAVGATMMSEVTDLLKSRRSAEDISGALVEVLGFEQLDLVSDVLSQRESVVRALEKDDSAVETRAVRPTSRTTADRQPRSERAAKPYTPGSQVVVQTREQVLEAKRAKAEGRRLGRSRADGDGVQYTPEQLERMREEALRAAGDRPLFTSEGTREEPVYPHVFTSGAGGNTLSVFGSKFVLPVGTTREEKENYEEITIPPARNVPMRSSERLIPISELDGLARGAFPGYKTLNRIQSAVYPIAYKTNENMLVCAPTGAGKTDVAMLTVLRVLSQYSTAKPNAKSASMFNIATNDFKIIYVAPMKALAAEVVRKFGKRLGYLDIKVRELTGDMQMTRAEIAETQMIVTTPEKWDVVTRKTTGEGELASKVKLLIIDEVHLLHEERGAVIESIVARTLRQVESSQSLIRIVGLSATLPNYLDVADFLRVNRYQGLFFFDSSFRPVPLEQHFIGVKGKPNSPQSKTNLDRATFEKVSELVQQGHQVMVFVHARKETVKTAQTLREMAAAEGLTDFFDDSNNPKRDGFKREVGMSRNRELRELFDHGFGIHHAGMLRSDRNLSERMFEANVTKVLCCTATLAWGVNLPAFAVVIKGTQVYDSGKGAFVDLSILDVLQIFGRAGRPQYEDLGIGYICTTHDKLSHYVDAICTQHPIESKFVNGLVDSLNAEVTIGSVNNIDEGVQWIGYSFLFVRMLRNPMHYGLTHDEPANDQRLGSKRHSLITLAARKLAAAKMVQFDETVGSLTITDLGRIASKYYIPHKTVEIFNEQLRPSMSEADVLALLSLATDFEQIMVRDSEEKELKKLLEAAPCQVKGGTETSSGKVNVLLQAYISRAYVEDFALVSDSAYVAQNSGRIIRALLEMAMAHKWASVTAALLSMSKGIERRMWPFDHPLAQCGLSPETMYSLQRWADEVEIADLANMPTAELGQLIHQNERSGSFVKQAARQLPWLSINYYLRPVSHNLLRIVVKIDKAFDWSDKLHGSAESFWVWVEDEASVEILQWSHAVLRQSTPPLSLAYILSIQEPVPKQLHIRWLSDRWIGSEDLLVVPLDRLIMPEPAQSPLPLLNLPLLSSVSAFSDPVLKALCSQSFPAFNAIQTQCFHTLYHTQSNALISAPSASGKSSLGEVAIWRALRRLSSGSALYLLPQRHLAKQQAILMRSRFAEAMNVRVLYASSASEFAQNLAMSRTVLFSTPTTVIRALARKQGLIEKIRKISVVVADELHQLDSEYEVVLTKLRRLGVGIGVRLVGLTASLEDARSLEQWLNVKPTSSYAFQPKDRGSPLHTSFVPFNVAHSIALLKAMAKPAYDRIKPAIVAGPAICFVPSRAQCIGTGADLIRISAQELAAGVFLSGASQQDVEPYARRLGNSAIAELLMHGIGVFHEGLSAPDMELVLHLFASGVLRVLMVPRDAVWSLPPVARARLVVVMGTQYVRLSGGGERTVQDYTHAELVRMQSLAVRPSEGQGECVIMCQAAQAEYLSRLLLMGLPLESSLAEDDGLVDMVLSELVDGRIRSRQDAVDLTSWTFFFHRLRANPSFYDAEGRDIEDINDRLSRLVDDIFDRLLHLGLVTESPATVRIDDVGDDSVQAIAGGRQVELTAIGRAIAQANRAGLQSLQHLHQQLSTSPVALRDAVIRSFPSGSGNDAPVADEEVQALRSLWMRLPHNWKLKLRFAAKEDKDDAEQPHRAPDRPAAEVEKTEVEASEGAATARSSLSIPSFSAQQKMALLLAVHFLRRPLEPSSIQGARNRNSTVDGADHEVVSPRVWRNLGLQQQSAVLKLLEPERLR